MASAQEYWNGYYEKNVFSGGKAPLDLLERFVPRLSRGKVLDIGMGEGANAVYLAQKGFQVKGFDLSAVALERAKQLARDTGVGLEAGLADLDLYLFGLMEYDTMIMSYFKPALPRYYSEVIRSLKQGGTLLVESFLFEEQKEVLGPEEAYRNYYYKSNELLQNLRGMKILFYQEDLVSGKHRVQCLAQKPQDKDVARYGLFDMQSGTKETGPTAQQKLAESLFRKK